MGAAHRRRMAERLMAGGLPPRTPVTAVQRATGPTQATVRTTLERLGEEALAPPVTIVIGEVAALDLGWFERRPLFGKTVVVTRAAHQSSSLSERLRDLGAEVLEVPAIAVASPADGGASLGSGLARLKAGAYAWVVFTSANAVQRFFEHVPDTRTLGSVLVAAVGATTAEELRDFQGRGGPRARGIHKRGAPELVPGPASPVFGTLSLGTCSLGTFFQARLPDGAPAPGRRRPARTSTGAGRARLVSGSGRGVPDCACADTAGSA